MKKIILALIALIVTLTAGAKVIRITLDNGSRQVITSSEVSSIDFNSDGTLTVTTWDGGQQTVTADRFEEVNVGTDEEVVDEDEYTMSFSYSSKEYFTRGAHRIRFVYPSTDPQGNPISLSGIIMIPDNIYNGEDDSEGILLFNHYTIFNQEEAPTRGYFYLEGMFMANPLNLNYIVVESDFYGFGATVRFPQAYVQGVENARASLDCLLAAKRILEGRGVDYGPLLFNVGYSSGGFDALATQKCRDMEYAGEVSFDKTFAGGSPSDLKECYRQYVTIDSTAYNAVPPLLMVSTNETQGLHLDYYDVFQPFVADKIDEWILSKKYSSWPVCDSIGREKKIHEILTATYCDLNSPESVDIQKVLKQLSITTDWTPDPTQRIYVMHSRGDDYVPVASARGIVSFLEENGFKASVIPGKTNLQTNFLVTNMGHLSATLVYLAQTVAALKAWPVMYTDGQLNPIYDRAINNELPDPVLVMRYLDSMGVDCRAIIMQLVDRLSGDGDEGGIDASIILARLNEICESMGLSTDDVLEMLKDSGIDLTSFVIELLQYLSEEDSGDMAARLVKAESGQATPAQEYERQLNDWMLKSGIVK